VNIYSALFNSKHKSESLHAIYFNALINNDFKNGLAHRLSKPALSSPGRWQTIQAMKGVEAIVIRELAREVNRDFAAYGVVFSRCLRETCGIRRGHYCSQHS